MNPRARPARWDLFCRVIDNLGDAAILWRLARQLSLEHGYAVRLFIDQPAVLQRLLPGAASGATIDGVALHGMPADGDADDHAGEKVPGDAARRPADVVVCGLHADLPAGYRRRMRLQPPTWINLEYLSAESWIDGFHGLPSPQADGLIQYFYYPGFSAGSGGLLRESDLFARRDAFLADPAPAARFLDELGVERRPGERLASLLCYPEAPLQSIAAALAGSEARLHLVIPEGAAGPALDRGALESSCGAAIRVTSVPFLAQYDYDCLLWSSDVNFVRGEDSWIRALWAGKPFVWQVYLQSQEVHLTKLDAFLRLLGPPEDEGTAALARACRWWNQAPGAHARGVLADLLRHRVAAAKRVTGLARQVCAGDLASRLIAFAESVSPDTAGTRQGPADPDRVKL